MLHVWQIGYYNSILIDILSIHNLIGYVIITLYIIMFIVMVMMKLNIMI
jgi:hypothetical protein